MTDFTTYATWSAGQTVSATDLNTQIRDNGNHLCEQISRAGWTSFTPSFTNLTVGSGTLVGKYAYAGKSTIFRVELIFAGDTSISGSVLINLPQTSVTYQSAYHPFGLATFYDANDGIYNGRVIYSSTSACALVVEDTSGTYSTTAVLSSTVPFTWTTSDKILLTAIYERA